MPYVVWVLMSLPGYYSAPTVVAKYMNEAECKEISVIMNNAASNHPAWPNAPKTICVKSTSIRND